MSNESKINHLVWSMQKSLQEMSSELGQLRVILVEQIGTHTVVTNQPDYDVSNATKPDVLNEIAEKYSIAPPKFDPNTADKSKMYFAVHKELGESIVQHDGDAWYYVTASDVRSDLSGCTHIDHEPIERRN